MVVPNLILKDSKDGATVVESHDGKWMCDKVVLGLILVGFQGNMEDSLET